MKEEIKNWVGSAGFLAEISNLSIVTRYPGDFQRMLKDFSKERTKFILTRTKEIFQWIKKSIAL